MNDLSVLAVAAAFGFLSWIMLVLVNALGKESSHERK
jgi:hypothetical protein